MQWCIVRKYIPNLVARPVTSNRILGTIEALSVFSDERNGDDNANEAIYAQYELVVASLHRFRGGMTPTNAEEEAPAAVSSEALSAILTEVRAIRQAMER